MTVPKHKLIREEKRKKEKKEGKERGRQGRKREEERKQGGKQRVRTGAVLKYASAHDPSPAPEGT